MLIRLGKRLDDTTGERCEACRRKAESDRKEKEIASQQYKTMLTGLRRRDNML